MPLLNNTQSSHWDLTWVAFRDLWGLPLVWTWVVEVPGVSGHVTECFHIQSCTLQHHQISELIFASVLSYCIKNPWEYQIALHASMQKCESSITLACLLSLMIVLLKISLLADYSTLLHWSMLGYACVYLIGTLHQQQTWVAGQYSTYFG
jgi:hypothetical protein